MRDAAPPAPAPVAAGERPATLARLSARSGAGMAAALASGLVLDAVIAVAYGAGAVSDAFFVAARIPLGLSLVMLAGATAMLTPALVRAADADGTARADDATSRLLVGAVLGSVALWALAAAVAEPVTLLTAPGLGDAARHEAVLATRVMFGVVPLVIAAEVLRARVNATERFGAAAAMNVVMNGVAAAVVIVRGGLGADDLALAYVLGAAAQLGYIAVLAARAGFRFRPRGWGDGQAAGLARLMTRPAAGAGVNLVNRLGEQVVCSFLPAGSITVVNYGVRLTQAAAGLVGRSAAVAALPRLTRAAGAGDDVAFARTSRHVLRLMIAVTLPLTGVLVVLARPAVEVVFRRGNFSAADARLLGLVVAVLAVGLIGSAVQRALLTPFNARLEPSAALRTAVVCLLVEAVLLAPLVVAIGPDRPRAVLGVAVAVTVSQLVAAGYAWSQARRHLDVDYRPVVGSVARTAAVSVAATAAMGLASAAIHPLGDNTVLVVVRSAAVAATGAAVLAAGLGLARRLHPTVDEAPA
ncbi:MAG: lipid II flippase MurJ [Acidimicrobiales bacterium]